MQFQQVTKIDGGIDPDSILYTDEAGSVWLAPKEHRFWFMYQDWLALGNTPLPPA